mgnify:CR=1 FL=1
MLEKLVMILMELLSVVTDAQHLVLLKLDGHVMQHLLLFVLLLVETELLCKLKLMLLKLLRFVTMVLNLMLKDVLQIAQEMKLVGNAQLQEI